MVYIKTSRLHFLFLVSLVFPLMFTTAQGSALRHKRLGGGMQSSSVRSSRVLLQPGYNRPVCQPRSSQQARRLPLAEAAVDLTRRSLLLGISAAPSLAAVRPQPAYADVTVQDQRVASCFERVESFTLDNGLTFVVLPRSPAPVVSCHIYAGVGAWEEQDGQTGLAHLLEHLAFKGTRRIGSKDWATESQLLNSLDEMFYERRALKQQAAQDSSSSTRTRIQALTEQFKAMQAKAADLVVPNAYGSTLTREGGVGLNATTSLDQTRYFVSLPANKLELWFALESERFRAPVFREIYTEKEVIVEERRLRTDDSPLGKYQQEYALRALGNNYRRPIIGFPEDFEKLGRQEVAQFFSKHYGPSSLVIAVVGDVKVDEVHALAEKYWGSWTGAGAGPTPVTGIPAAADSSLPASSARPAVLAPSSELVYRDTAAGGPLCLLGFYRPSMNSAEGVRLQALSDILTGSRTSRLVSRLVLGDKRQLLGVNLSASWPGDARPGLALLSAVPQQGQSPDSALQSVWEEVDRFLQEGPTEREVARVKKATRVSLLGAALSNSSMASLLASYQALTGSWRGLLTELELLSDMTPLDVQTTAQNVLRKDNVFTGLVNRAAL